MRFFAAALIFFGVAASYAQAPEVPHKIHFAGMSLTIRDDARREIQKDVDALAKHKRYFEMNAERGRTYFPIIEKIFKEEELPEDFKFLALQESALTPDAVSVSNAVGFWQFKDYTANEMGLRVDNMIDERMNIVSATRGAARYIKQNNYRFNNWLLALQSYQMGAGGVERAVGDRYNGDSHMEITSETYWYVKKYLAHKVAFEGACQGAPKLQAGLYENKTERRLDEIARELSVEEAVLKDYNKRVKQGTIPGDKSYYLFIPGGNPLQDFNNLVLTSDKASKATPRAGRTQLAGDRMMINGIDAVKANPGETLNAMARRVGLNVSKFIGYNDVAIDHELVPGTFYFLKKKKKKNISAHYKAKMGDDLWLVSQKFGVRLKNLRKLNAGLTNGLLASGTSIRLNDLTVSPQAPTLQLTPVASTPDEVAELSRDTFSWGTQGGIKPQPVVVAASKEQPADSTSS
ncbi:MAG TPA: transglycosylase SLT domain-containing protein, partial [Cyclobacteriaceae bacterium]|nr:transglycosylase SLT domain-containing protein [Cyclobacteriaceae bacterium]